MTRWICDFVCGTRAPPGCCRASREVGRRGGLPRRSSNPLQATILLLTCLSGGAQIRTPQAIRALWALPRHGAGPTFGQQLFLLMESASSATGRENFHEEIIGLNVAHNQRVAVIKHSDNQSDEYFVNPAVTVDEDRHAIINSLFIVTSKIFLILGEVVIQNRQTARQLSTSIPWRETWLALGFEPPDRPFPLKPLVPIFNPSSASTTAEAGTKNAGPRPQGPAPSLDQDHSSIRDPDSPEIRREREMKLKPQRFALLVISYQPAARSCDDDENPCFARCSVSLCP